MRILAIIPARGGSKGVKRKNIRLLAGKPLIMHSIEVAKKSKRLNEILVNTDDEEIAEIARNCGVNVLIRPSELASDKAPVIDTVLFTLNELKSTFDVVILLQPTSPLRSADDIDAIIEMFERDTQLEGVISVVAMFDQHPARMYRINSDNEMQPFLSEGETKRRQDLEPVFYRNGCFYAARTDALQNQNTLMPRHKKAYVMDANWLVNIDEERDFKIAEVIFEEWKKMQ